MTVPSQSTIRALNTNNNRPSFYPNDNKIDQFIRKLKFEPMEYSTDQFEFHRASSLPTVTFFGQGGTVNNNVAAVSTETNTFVRLGQTCSLDLLDQLSSRNDYDNYFSQLEEQVRGTKLSMLRELSDQLITGTGGTDLRGLSTKIATDGDGTSFTGSNPFILDDLYVLANLCRSTDDYVGSYSGRYFISNERALREVMHLLDNTGRTIEFQYDEDLQTEIPVIFGVPWLITDVISTTTEKPITTTIYMAQLEGKTGIKMLYAKESGSDCDRWGIHTFDIPLQQTSSQISKGVAGFYSLMIPEASLARIESVRLANTDALP